MTKKEIEEIVGKELSDDHVSLDKKIYAGKLYFYKREVDNDHYFYVPARETLYKMVFNPANYNDSITETGKYADSFQYPFEEFLADGKIEVINQNNRLLKVDNLKEDIIKKALLTRLQIIADEIIKIKEVINNL